MTWWGFSLTRLASWRPCRSLFVPLRRFALHVWLLLCYGDNLVSALIPFSTRSEAHEQTTTLQVRDTHVAMVRGFEIELYGRKRVRTRGGGHRDDGLRFIDVGEWRVGRYVRWSMNLKSGVDYFLLDEVDEKLRDIFPVGTGTVQRVDFPLDQPSVRLSSVR